MEQGLAWDWWKKPPLWIKEKRNIVLTAEEVDEYVGLLDRQAADLAKRAHAARMVAKAMKEKRVGFYSEGRVWPITLARVLEGRVQDLRLHKETMEFLVRIAKRAVEFVKEGGDEQDTPAAG